MVNKFVDLILYLVSFLATAGALGIMVYTQVIYSPPVLNNTVETKNFIESEKDNSYPREFELKDIVVNLKSKTKRLRYLDLKIFLVPFNPDQKKILERNKDLIYDSIIDITSGMAPDELNTLSGKLIFQSRIINDINKLIKVKVVKEIHLAKYVII